MKRTWPIEIDCPNCAAKLEAALAKVPGVLDVTVNYVQKQLVLEAEEASFAAVMQAVLAGEISRERIDESVLRILKLKIETGILR